MKETDKLAIDCITGKPVLVDQATGATTPWQKAVPSENLPFVGPGLVDLQVNGIRGIDFNGSDLSVEGVERAVQYLLASGTTTFFPTIITNSKARTIKLLKTIDRACVSNELAGQCIGGIHLEGPFISPHDGARGAHSKRHVTAPDWELFSAFQRASGNRIRLVTLSPEWDSAPEFITRCKKSGVRVALGHSLATPDQIGKAVEAGAILSTHLGNAVPLMLPRHPNIIWEQLASDKLWASIIADGFHVPDSFIKVVMKTKGKKCLLVSDSTSFTGMKPGTYRSHIGGQVVLEENGRLAMAEGKGLLAGAAKTLLQNVEYLVSKKLASLGPAWQMASIIPGRMIGKTKQEDNVVFSVDSGRLEISKVFVQGRLAYEKKNDLPRL